MSEDQNPDPRCPKCGFTMCELFVEHKVGEHAFTVTPNGQYQCYHCTPIKGATLPKHDIPALIEALRIRVLALTGEKWERDATRNMMKEAADRLEEMAAEVKGVRS